MEILKKVHSPVILTPHPGEMARLLRGARDNEQGAKKSEAAGFPPRSALTRIRRGEGVARGDSLRDAIERDRINTAVNFAGEAHTYLILKGVPTIVAEPEGRAFINSTGNPGMATAGAGDVLTGMVSSFLAQGLDPLNASLLGVFMHGLAGDLAAREKGMHSLIASDIIDALPAAFKVIAGDAAEENPL